MTFLDSSMAAAMIRSSTRTVRRLVERGVVANYGTPRYILIDAEELGKAVAEGKVTPPKRK